MVAITLKTFTSRPVSIEIDDNIEVGRLRDRVSRETGLPCDRLKLVHKGRGLTFDQEKLQLQENDVVLAVAAARAPPQHLKEVAGDAGHHDEEEGDLRFRLPPDAPTWQRRLAAFLRLQLGLPDVVLIILFGVKRRSLLVLAAWMLGWPVAARLEMGPIYILASIIAVMFFNLGKRQPGQASAYTIFNDFRELPGQLNADVLDQQLRTGQL